MLCCLCTLLHTYSISQSFQRIDLNLKGEPVDLIQLTDKNIHLVTSTSVYQFSNGQFSLLSNHPWPIQHRSSSEDTGLHFIYSGINDTNFRLDDKTNYLTLKQDYEAGTITWNQDFLIYANEDLDILTSDSTMIHSEFDSGSDSKWLSTFLEGVPYMIHKLHGVVYLDTLKMEFEQISHNWFGENPTALSGIEDKLFIGFNGGYSVYSNNTVRSKSLYKLIGTSPILKFLNHQSKNYILTPENVLVNVGSNHAILNIELESGDELVDIISGDNGKLIILSRRHLFILDTNESISFEGISNSDALIDLYKIRDRTYYSNGNSVYKFNPYTSSWMLNPNKIPPQHINTDKDRNTFLVFKNEAILLDKANAEFLGKWPIPAEEVFNIQESEGGVFLCTDQNLYLNIENGWEKLNSDQDSFLNIIVSDRSLHTISSSGIYEISGEGLSLVESMDMYSFPQQGKWYKIQSNILIATQLGILQFDPDGNKAELIYKRQNILDFHVTLDQIFILTPKTLIAYDLRTLLNGRLEVKGVRRLESNWTQGKIYDFNDDRLWLASSSEIKQFKLNEFDYHEPIKFFLDKIESKVRGVVEVDNATEFNITAEDMPVKLSYQHNRYLAGEDQFRFHIGNNKNKETQWSNSPEMVFDQNDAGHYYIQAEMIDGISNSSIEAIPIQIHVLKPAQLNVTTVLIVTLGALFLILLIVRGINRK